MPSDLRHLVELLLASERQHLANANTEIHAGGDANQRAYWRGQIRAGQRFVRELEAVLKAESTDGS